jgi:hypothetical protein
METGSRSIFLFAQNREFTPRSPHSTWNHPSAAFRFQPWSIAPVRFADNFHPSAHNGIEVVSANAVTPIPVCEIRTMMKKITVAVHERTYHQARVWAAEHDTSLSAVVAYLLETLPGIPRAARAFPSPQSPSAPTPTALPDTPAAPSGQQNAARIL